VSGSYGTGGLVGQNDGTVSNSYASGNVSGSDFHTGGLVGYNKGTVSNSYATGNVSGSIITGGLVGYNKGTVSNSYSTGSVTGSSYTGGLVGYNQFTVSNSFWDITTSVQSTSSGGLGLTTAQMQTQANFTSATAANGNANPGWDFANIWVMYEGYTAPLLRSFMMPLTVTANNAAKTYDGLAYNGSAGVSYSITSDMSKLLGTLGYTGGINVGTHAITPFGLYSNQQGYFISYANGSLSITPAGLTSGNYDIGVLTGNGADLAVTGIEPLHITGTPDTSAMQPESLRHVIAHQESAVLQSQPKAPDSSRIVTVTSSGSSNRDIEENEPPTGLDNGAVSDTTTNTDPTLAIVGSGIRLPEMMKNVDE
jgi:hypothetical protein